VQLSDYLNVEESGQVSRNVERVVDRSQTYRSLPETHPYILRVCDTDSDLEAQSDADCESVTEPYKGQSMNVDACLGTYRNDHCCRPVEPITSPSSIV